MSSFASLSARAAVAPTALRRAGKASAAKPVRSVVAPRAALADIPTDNKATKVGERRGKLCAASVAQHSLASI
jgi:hypothetical protein